MNRPLSLALLGAMVLAQPARAELELDIRADVGSRVYLDDEYVGETPIILSRIQPGTHRVGVENPRTGEIKSYAVYSSRSADVSKVLWANFIPDSPPPSRARLSRPVPVHDVHSRHVPPGHRKHAWKTPAPSRPARAESRGKTHTRNTLLGLTAASQIFGDEKKDRVRHRNVGLGLTVINEIFRK